MPLMPIVKFRSSVWRLAPMLVLALVVAGCAQNRPVNNPLDPLGIIVPGVEYYENPVQIPRGQPEQVWEIVIDVLDDYFEIDREEPLCQIESTSPDGQLESFVLEGHVETFPCIGATLLEPWRHDSANLHERIEATIQSIRRQATVRVIPDEAGYKVDVAVYKQLEDVVKPEHSVSGAATFRYDDSLNRIVNPVVETPIDAGWIPLGRDMALEQRIIAQILSRTGTVCKPCGPTMQPTGGTTPVYNSGQAPGVGYPTPIPTPAPENGTSAPSHGNTWSQDPNSMYSVPAPGWRAR